MVKAGKGSLPVVMNGKSYAVDTLASSCAASFSALLEECDLDTMVPSLEAQNSQLSGSALYNAVWAMHSACLEDPTAASLGIIPRENLAAAFDVSPATIADELDPFRDGLGFVAPGFDACEQYNYAIRGFAEAALFQGRFPGTVEVHHRWHEKTAEALFYMGKMLALCSRAAATTNARKTQRVCATTPRNPHAAVARSSLPRSPQARALPAIFSEKILQDSRESELAAKMVRS